MGTHIREDNIHTAKEQALELSQLVLEGRVLDIGGGGEGIIGLIGKKQVVAIDISKRSLEEAPKGPLKIEMNAAKLFFLENSFDTVTSFFSLLYIEKQFHEAVFSEMHRVLVPFGILRIWETHIPEYNGGKRDIYLLPLKIQIDNKQIKTGYGVSWKEHRQSSFYYEKLAEASGFRLHKKELNGELFYLEFIKF